MSNRRRRHERMYRGDWQHRHDDWHRYAGHCRCKDCRKALKRAGVRSAQDRRDEVSAGDDPLSGGSRLHAECVRSGTLPLTVSAGRQVPSPHAIPPHHSPG